MWDVVRLMRQMVEAGKQNPIIIKAARATVFLTPEKSPIHEIIVLFELVRDGVRYVQDIYGVETLSDADKTLLSRQGDCDDQVILLCALFESVGYQTRFIIAGYSDPRCYDHVYCQVNANGRWIDCDPTEKQNLGWAPPNPLIIDVER